MNQPDSPQLRIDQAIRQLGGYWPPLAGLARILEELAELASAQTADERRCEAVDCVVAALAVANQYSVRVCGDHHSDRQGEGERDALIAAGQIARLVNRFEGSKPPKLLEEGAIPLEAAFGTLVGALAGPAGMTTVEILQAAADTADSNAIRDKGRFVVRTDAVTAASRDAYIQVVGGTQAGPTDGVWGVDASASEEVIDEIRRFIRVDAVHPLTCLVAGPLQEGEKRLQVLWVCFQDSAPPNNLSKIDTARGIFIRLAGRR